MAPHLNTFIATHETALCLIPPRDQCNAIDGFRSANDKNHGKWPPHVNVLYPFVYRTCIQQTLAVILPIFQDARDILATPGIRLSLSSPGLFQHKQSATLFVHDEDPTRLERLASLRELVLNGLRWGNNKACHMHMTVAQCEEAPDSPKRRYLVEKLRLLPSVSWEARQLHLLIRDESTGFMKVHGHIGIASGILELERPSLSADFALSPIKAIQIEPRQSYRFSNSLQCWASHQAPMAPEVCIPEHLIVASYNVLAEFEWPPCSARYPLIVRNLLAKTAQADVVVLQEVADDFLTHLLSNQNIQQIYPFATHGLPDGLSTGPLPSLLNVVVLSRHSFRWGFLPFQRRHKGCSLLAFDHIGTHDEQGHALPVILAATHLSQGLTDGAVFAKCGELQRIINYLGSSHTRNVWILAGDLNVATSSYTLNIAVKTGSISRQTRASLDRIDTMLREAQFVDSWAVARMEVGESSDNLKMSRSLCDAFEGEQGATFDPQENSLAAATMGSGFNNRPQRYDRILLKDPGVLTVQGFNMFGFNKSPAGMEETQEPASHASDHWGVRCLLLKRRQTPGLDAAPTPQHMAVTVLPAQAPAGLSSTDSLQKCLHSRQCIPTDSQEDIRRDAFELIKSVVLDSHVSNGPDTLTGRFPVVLIPVGSYGLGVWTLDSDLDCFCIGACSAVTFFRLVRQRIAKSTSDVVRVLRKVKSKSGTMLILEVRGVRVDLQYCQAPHIAEAWPEIIRRQPTDPAFALKFEALLKLKPARDLFYLLYSIPDLVQFRMAYQLIKEWAKIRGIYGARFGYLGGIHISVLLVRICKMLSHSGNNMTATSVITTFFDHYATFNWQTQVAFDPFFHKQLRYDRSFREPLCIIGWHSPVLNTSSAASRPTVKTLERELQRARDRMLTHGMTWSKFLGGDDPCNDGFSVGAQDFLKTYKSYIKMDLHYWGSSLEDGCRLVGWLESRCVSILVDIGMQLPGLVARIWPQRFTESHTESFSTSRHYHGLYLIGLDWDEVNGEPISKLKLKLSHGTLQEILQQFTRRIRGAESYFDPQRSWFNASLVPGSELGRMSPDDQDWGEYQSDDQCSDEDVADPTEASSAASVEPAHHSKCKTGSSRSHKAAAPLPRPQGAAKLRTAADVLHRLRWDPGMSSDDFVIGYTDRHLPEPQEKAVGAWKLEQTHEEFIPQHRILYFRRKSDGVLVWERSSRTDMIFGTGLQPSSAQ